MSYQPRLPTYSPRLLTYSPVPGGTVFKAITFTVNKFEHVYNKLMKVYCKLRLYTEVNNKQLICLHHCCTVKI